jgi:hypothetical protein
MERLAAALLAGHHVVLLRGQPSGLYAWVRLVDTGRIPRPVLQVTEQLLDERVDASHLTDNVRSYQNPNFTGETRAAAEKAMRLRERRGHAKPATSAGQEIR